MELTDKNEISINFSKMPVFLSLSDDDKKVLIGKCDLKSFDAGSTIIEQGDNTTTVYFYSRVQFMLLIIRVLPVL